MNGFTADDVRDQAGKCFIVTGSNSGIGYEIAYALAAKRARVVLACRDETKAQRAISLIRQDYPGADIMFMALDLERFH